MSWWTVLLEKSRLTLLATKRAVDAASEEMLATTGAWSDADSLMTALADPESRAQRGGLPAPHLQPRLSCSRE